MPLRKPVNDAGDSSFGGPRPRKKKAKDDKPLSRRQQKRIERRRRPGQKRREAAQLKRRFQVRDTPDTEPQEPSLGEASDRRRGAGSTTKAGRRNNRGQQRKRNFSADRGRPGKKGRR